MKPLDRDCCMYFSMIDVLMLLLRACLPHAQQQQQQQIGNGDGDGDDNDDDNDDDEDDVHDHAEAAGGENHELLHVQGEGNDSGVENYYQSQCHHIRKAGT